MRERERERVSERVLRAQGSGLEGLECMVQACTQRVIPRSGLGVRVSYEKTVSSKLSGDEVYHTIS